VMQLSSIYCTTSLCDTSHPLLIPPDSAKNIQLHQSISGSSSPVI